MTALKAPYPYFGGKSRVAPAVWARFGACRNYVEPFFGSGAVLLGRPTPFAGPETVNDADGFVANFWRALQTDPATVAVYADNPVNENDLHARHAWLVRGKAAMQARLEGDPDWFDAKAAGWWAWGLSCWIGSGFASGDGPWGIVETAAGPILAKTAKPGCRRKLPHLGDAGRGIARPARDLHVYLAALADRLRNVRVCCGDWSRVCGPSVTSKHSGVTAVFLDPPYGTAAKRDTNLYGVESQTVAADVLAWCVELGHDPKLRIALCGYEGEHEALESAGWSVVTWKAAGGFGSQSAKGAGRANATRERIWYSPHCIAASAASAA